MSEPLGYFDEMLANWEKQWEATGLLPVLFAAVRLCGSEKFPLPDWASLAVQNLIIDAHNTQSLPGKKGPHSTVKSRMTKDYAHYMRWNAVSAAMRLRNMSDLPSKQGRPTESHETRHAVLVDAIDMLANNKFAQVVTEKSIGDSYEMVEKSRRTGEARFLFDAFDLIAPQ